MKHVLVTGGAGFVGSNLVRMLVDKYNCHVTVLDNMLAGSYKNLQYKGILSDIELVEGSVMDVNLLEKLISGKDTVFHLATVTMVPSMENPRRDLETNIIGTFNVLETSLKNGIKRLVYTSTSSVYGNPQTLPISEKHDLQFLSFYSASKYAAESYAQVFNKQYGLPITVVRYSNVYGYNQRPENSYTGVIAKFVEWALNNEPLRIHGDGQQTRDFTFVDDACRATILAALSPHALGQTYNIGTSTETTINELARMVIELTDSASEVVYLEKRSIDKISRRVLNIELARKELHFDPQWTLNQGLQETIQWFCSHR